MIQIHNTGFTLTKQKWSQLASTLVVLMVNHDSRRADDQHCETNWCQLSNMLGGARCRPSEACHAGGSYRSVRVYGTTQVLNHEPQISSNSHPFHCLGSRAICILATFCKALSDAKQMLEHGHIFNKRCHVQERKDVVVVSRWDLFVVFFSSWGVGIGILKATIA